MRLRIFVFFLALFAATTAGHVYTVDGYLNFLVAKSIGGRGRLEIPRFMMTVEGEGGRHYSKLGIGQSLVSIPLFWLGNAIESESPGGEVFRAYSCEFMIPHDTGTIVARPQTLIGASDEEGARLFFALLTNALVAAGLCLVFWMLLRDYGLSEAGALWGTALLAFATPLWVYSRDFFSEPLFALCLLGSFYLLKSGAGKISGKHLALAGLFSSVGILARASFIPIVMIFAAYLALASGDGRKGLRGAGKYLAFCVPGVVTLGLLNAARFGSPLATGYHTAFDKGFSLPILKGLVWNLASPYRSLFLYAPATLLVFPGAVTFAGKYRRQAWLIAAIVAYVFIVYSKWWAWHGGWCWGPRFLVPVIPLLLLPGLAAISVKGRWLLATAILLGLAGFAVQLGGVLINYTAAYDYWIKIGKLDWGEADIHLFSPITIHFRSLLATAPRNYDLWLIQAYQISPAVMAGLVVLLAVAVGYALSPFIRSKSDRVV